MAKCKNCKYLHTMYDRRDESFKWCAQTNDCPHEDIERCCKYYRPMTNADRIRSMTDQELAIHMGCPNDTGLAEIECDKSDSCNCYECLLDWLWAERRGIRGESTD